MLSLAVSAFAITPESAAKDLGKYGIMNGFPDGSFRFEANVTRAQLCKMVITAMGREKLDPYAGADNSVFRDMAKTHWAYSCVSDAFMCKIVSGFPDSTFRPDESVTYAQALKLIMLATGSNKERTLNFYRKNGYIVDAKHSCIKWL